MKKFTILILMGLINSNFALANEEALRRAAAARIEQLRGSLTREQDTLRETEKSLERQRRDLTQQQDAFRAQAAKRIEEERKDEELRDKELTEAAEAAEWSISYEKENINRASKDRINAANQKFKRAQSNVDYEVKQSRINAEEVKREESREASSRIEQLNKELLKLKKDEQSKNESKASQTTQLTEIRKTAEESVARWMAIGFNEDAARNSTRSQFEWVDELTSSLKDLNTEIATIAEERIPELEKAIREAEARRLEVEESKTAEFKRIEEEKGKSDAGIKAALEKDLALEKELTQGKLKEVEEKYRARVEERRSDILDNFKRKAEERAEKKGLKEKYDAQVLSCLAKEIERTERKLEERKQIIATAERELGESQRAEEARRAAVLRAEEERRKLTKSFNTLKTRLQISSHSPNDIELDLKKDAQKLQADLLDSYRPAPAIGNGNDEFIGDIHGSLIPLEQYFALQCLLKKENPDQEPSPEKITSVRNKLNTLSQTIETFEGIDQLLDPDGLDRFKQGANYLDNFINGNYGPQFENERRATVYNLDAFFDLVAEETKEFALRNKISAEFQQFKAAVGTNPNSSTTLPTAYLIWGQLCLATGNETPFAPTELSHIPGNDIRNAIGSLIQDIKNEDLHMNGLERAQKNASIRTFKEYVTTLKTQWTIDKYSETFTTENGANLVTERYWSKFLPNLVFYLHGLIDAGGVSMDLETFPGARCPTGTKADLLVSAGRMLTGRMDANIDFGDCRVVR
jgi:hypothetical protein